MSPRARRRDLLTLAGGAALGGLVHAAPPAGATLRIGQSLPLTGPLAAVVRPMAEGQKALIDEVNAEGGIRGVPLETADPRRRRAARTHAGQHAPPGRCRPRGRAVRLCLRPRAVPGAATHQRTARATAGRLQRRRPAARGRQPVSLHHDRQPARRGDRHGAQPRVAAHAPAGGGGAEQRPGALHAAPHRSHRRGAPGDRGGLPGRRARRIQCRRVGAGRHGEGARGHPAARRRPGRAGLHEGTAASRPRGGLCAFAGRHLGARRAARSRRARHGLHPGGAASGPSHLAAHAPLRRAMARAGLPASYDRLWGYLNALVLAEVLRRAGPGPTPATVFATLERLGELDLGGYRLTFGPGRHHGSGFVEITIVDQNGKFVR